MDELLEQPHVNAAELVTNLLTLFMDKIPLEKIQTTTEIDETSRNNWIDFMDLHINI